MVEFGFAILVGSEDAIVDEPELAEFRVDINAGHNPDAANHCPMPRITEWVLPLHCRRTSWMEREWFLSATVSS